MGWLKRSSYESDMQIWDSVKDSDVGYVRRWVRYKAIKRITNQQLLEQIVLKDEDSDVREEAINRITNQQLLDNLIYKFTKDPKKYTGELKLIDKQLKGIG